MKSIDDLTYLRKIISAENKTHDEIVEKYWGENAFVSMIGDHDEIPNSIIFAVYNDDIDETCQHGTLTEIFDNDNNIIAYEIYRDLIF